MSNVIPIYQGRKPRSWTKYYLGLGFIAGVSVSICVFYFVCRAVSPVIAGRADAGSEPTRPESLPDMGPGKRIKQTRWDVQVDPDKASATSCATPSEAQSPACQELERSIGTPNPSLKPSR